MNPVTFKIPIKTISESNSHEHWRLRQKRAKSQRGAAFLYGQVHKVRLLPLPLVVTITRVGPSSLDSDNLAGSQKHIRDGLADAIGIDDGNAAIEWRYAQMRGGKGVYAVKVHIARREP